MMKKYLLIILPILLISLSHCDIVEDPYADSDGPVGPGDEQFNDTVYNDTTLNTRKLLLEEFTGHKCPNCPAGADVAHVLRVLHPDEFVVVSIHNSGSFSKPDPPDFPSDFETETGENLRIKFQAAVFPIGLINRGEFSGSFLVDFNLWENTVNNLLADSAYSKQRFKVYLENIYNTKERSLRVRPRVVTKMSVTGNIAIAAYVMESHIIAPQEDNRQTPAYIPQYEHNHVLRVGFPNKGAGRTIFTNPNPGDTFEGLTDPNELTVSIDAEWKPENCDVVVFIYNIDTEEILQVEEMRLSNQ